MVIYSIARPFASPWPPISRNAVFSTFPVAFRGKAAKKTTRLGTLYVGQL